MTTCVQPAGQLGVPGLTRTPPSKRAWHCGVRMLQDWRPPAAHSAPAPAPAPACIAQVVGPAGLGKTQLCLQLSVLACLERQADGGSVVYLDTEKKFSSRRCVQAAWGAVPPSLDAGGTETSAGALPCAARVMACSLPGPASRALHNATCLHRSAAKLACRCASVCDTLTKRFCCLPPLCGLVLMAHPCVLLAAVNAAHPAKPHPSKPTPRAAAWPRSRASASQTRSLRRRPWRR